MFGVIVSGRPVLTDSHAITPNQLAFSIPTSPPFSHIVVFLLPGAQLPADAAAAVYVQIPPSTDFTLLGALAADKQSAIFKLSGVGGSMSNQSGAGGAATDDVMVDEATGAADRQQAAGPPVTLGISIEPAQQVAAALAAKGQSRTGPGAGLTGSELVKQQPGMAHRSSVPTKVLAQRIIANAFNFLASFAGNTGPSGAEVVPLKSFQDWWAKFEKKVELDPGFLEREEG
ncbi:hypothetical protein BDY21DRAFT_370694 [Lineolata rhizophorae]|uniref:Uncharacterized protein n=1 Tax=Lineolata rhizophorae TaxID=578093 RepID=A0A6A6P5H1_9PEZI|nr:hypothetical protein BDY21DRAFT_370694 [Lineolata rhizophorae]